MNQLINKTEVINDLKKDITESDNWLVIAIYLALTVRIMSYKNIDAVDVVRCRDCRYGHQYTNDKVHCSLGNDMYAYKPNDYCSYGERREDAN